MLHSSLIPAFLWDWLITDSLKYVWGVQAPGLRWVFSLQFSAGRLTWLAPLALPRKPAEPPPPAAAVKPEPRDAVVTGPRKTDPGTAGLGPAGPGTAGPRKAPQQPPWSVLERLATLPGVHLPEGFRDPRRVPDPPKDPSSAPLKADPMNAANMLSFDLTSQSSYFMLPSSSSMRSQPSLMGANSMMEMFAPPPAPKPEPTANGVKVEGGVGPAVNPWWKKVPGVWVENDVLGPVLEAVFKYAAECKKCAN